MQPTIFELWNTIDGYDNYQVSNRGRVRNTINANILKPWIAQITGYAWVSLSKSGKVKKYAVHRLVAFAFLENLDGYKYVDHIDRNKLNNDVTNLRWCTNQQNQQNKANESNCTSQYKGVHYDKSRNKWASKIAVDKKTIHIGRFDNEEDAGRAYDNKAAELFGEFAYFNFPEEWS